jgi:hypothetical protein
MGTAKHILKNLDCVKTHMGDRCGAPMGLDIHRRHDAAPVIESLLQRVWGKPLPKKYTIAS